MSGAEYHTALKGQSWKLRLMNTIDECMKYAADKDAFVSLMASEGLRRPLGERPQVHHLHHAGRTKMPRQQITRRKVLQGGHGA